ncbi:AAA-ATPase At2g46620-like [Impatiens glandulifera]|uniref:AAA-ATPase At2g46620-like n=1 Tax=Impatiens glandulifera TaxID=253017 RepID=UPI001FB074AD|nr:AAA-ATPase At2g46620-like [Impatiens glandulifera]
MPPENQLLFAALTAISVCFLVRFFLKTSILYLLRRWWKSMTDVFHAYQFYKVPQFNEHLQENQLYRKVTTYLNSLASSEDLEFANLFSGNKSNEINLVLDPHQTVADKFLGAKVFWNNEKSERDCSRVLVLKIRRSDKRRILQPYLQHIHAVYDEIEQRRKEVRLFFNAEAANSNGRWRSVPFTHPATIDTIAMESDLKNKIKSDLETFLKSKQYYHRLGRVWKRSYLLYGPSGTGKSSFAAGMAKFLSYDVYHIDLSKIQDDSDMKMLLLQTTPKSIILIEDLDRYLAEKSASGLSLSSMLNFMDGIFSCCGEERIMIFTMNCKEQTDPSILRPGRIDVHVQFTLCNFTTFKSLASSYLGLKEHKLFPQVEEMFQSGVSTLSQAEIGEIMISNRSSPSRALKSVINALQTKREIPGQDEVRQRLIKSGSGRPPPPPAAAPTTTEEEIESTSIFSREGGSHIKKLYGLLRAKSSRRGESLDLDSIEKENNLSHLQENQP